MQYNRNMQYYRTVKRNPQTETAASCQTTVFVVVLNVLTKKCLSSYFFAACLKIAGNLVLTTELKT